MMVSLMMIPDPEVNLMVEDAMGRAELALVSTLNVAAKKIFEQSQILVPKSDAHKPRPNHPSYPEKSLAKSGGIAEAALGQLQAIVYYDSPYAAAQEVGEMVYVNPRGEQKTVEWEVQNYTTPGTGPHYLEDSLKMVAGQIDIELAVHCRMAFGEIPGVVMSKSMIKAAGRQQELLPAATGEMAQALKQEGTQVANASVSSFNVPPTLQ